MTFNGITLIQTCNACPEQYDAYKDDKQVGFLYMRNGEFTVHTPSLGGQLIYSACPAGDGCFLEYEREMFLKNACLAITRHIDNIARNITTKAKQLC